MVQQIPSGDLGWVDGSEPEAWEVASAREEAAAASVPWCPVNVGFSATWTGDVCRFDPREGRPCPACGSRPGRPTVRPGEVCVVCSITTAGTWQRPMQEPWWPALRKRVKSRGLKGGVGMAARPEIAG